MIRTTFVALSVLFVSVSAGAELVRLRVEVDATELPRKILHTRMVVPVTGDSVDLWYPKWIPGIHGPRGPIRNLAGVRAETTDGERVTWKRDDDERFLFHFYPPRGAKEIVVWLDYLCSQPTTNSRGVDSYGNSLLGVINWNTCLLYPDGYDVEEIGVDLTLRLPDGWKQGSALPVQGDPGSVTRYDTVSFHDLVDSPLICGPYMRRIDLSTEDFPPVFLHLASESSAALQIGEDLEAKFAKMVVESRARFGGAPFDEYHLLLYLSDDFPRTGLEHLRSSLNGLGERDLEDPKKVDGWTGYLLPHEFAHAWCGKYRRPAGMATPDFHTTKRTNLLWVYEGLDQYLGEILCVRSGIWSMETYKESLALKLSRLMHQQGRQWRPLEDTAVDAYHLRGGVPAWGNWRRGQDYYNEGLLLWLEADAIIRAKTDNAKSLDDFCAAFMGDGPDVAVHPFTRDDLIAHLSELADHDWASFIRMWVEEPQDALPMTLVERLGYRLRYANERGEYLKFSEKSREYASAMDSLGMTVSESGTVGGSLVPGMPADKAGLAPGMKIVGVNERKFSVERFRDALKDSVARGSIRLLILDGDLFRTIDIAYDGGEIYLELVRDDDARDRIADIFAARAAE